MNQAMILAAFAFMTMIPLMITLAAISPIGNANSLSSNIMSRLGLSDDAETDIRALFAGPQPVRDAVTVLSVLLLVINAVNFPFALQRNYEHIWRLPPLGMRGWWRAMVWLLGFVVYVGFLAYVAPLNTRSTSRTLVSVMMSLLATTVGAWVTQYLLLGGRLRWWPLLPGAVATGVGLVILRSASALYPSKSIVASSAQYGPIGVVFVLLTWTIVMGWVILSAAVLGAVLYEHPVHLTR
jgi:membrane protein